MNLRRCLVLSCIVCLGTAALVAFSKPAPTPINCVAYPETGLCVTYAYNCNGQQFSYCHDPDANHSSCYCHPADNR